jgi:hypothetical protein
MWKKSKNFNVIHKKELVKNKNNNEKYKFPTDVENLLTISGNKKCCG